MPVHKHDRQYDLVVFGATGYTGKFTAENVALNLPTDLKWAVAGRSREKLQQVVSQCKSLNPDRRQPDIEVVNLNDTELAALAKKTFVLITTTGPYGQYGEPAFKACAENGTHYVDVTGEVPFVARMIKKYEAAAKASGAKMFPQSGIESVPSDLLTLSLAEVIREKFNAPVRDVTISVHKLSAAPSGGTLASALGILDNFTSQELRAAHVPFALSPVPNPNPASRPKSIVSRLTGLVTYPTLGLMTTSIAGMTDAAIVERTWGIFQSGSVPDAKPYGPNFSFKQHMKPRNWFTGILLHYGIVLLFLIMATPPLKALVKKLVFAPGEGPDLDVAKKDEIEFRGIAEPDVDGEIKERAFVRCWYRGSMYFLSGLLLAQAAATILEDDLRLEGGIYTPACLGQGFIDRLDAAKFHFESRVIDV
jgi:short subunit dehydrogenase-like uncharacterized protein